MQREAARMPREVCECQCVCAGGHSVWEQHGRCAACTFFTLPRPNLPQVIPSFLKQPNVCESTTVCH